MDWLIALIQEECGLFPLHYDINVYYRQSNNHVDNNTMTWEWQRWRTTLFIQVIVSFGFKCHVVQLLWVKLYLKPLCIMHYKSIFNALNMTCCIAEQAGSTFCSYWYKLKIPHFVATNHYQCERLIKSSIFPLLCWKSQVILVLSSQIVVVLFDSGFLLM